MGRMKEIHRQLLESAVATREIDDLMDEYQIAAAEREHEYQYLLRSSQSRVTALEEKRRRLLEKVEPEHQWVRNVEEEIAGLLLTGMLSHFNRPPLACVDAPTPPAAAPATLVGRILRLFRP